MSRGVRRLAGGGAFEDIAGYCRAVRAGSLILVSGTISPDSSLSESDTFTQTTRAFEAALEAAATLGGTRDDVLRTRILLAPAASWQEASRAHSLLFTHARPANTTYYVGRLIPDGALVEVELDADGRGAE
ncbi:Rid family hydrolase [Amycolatopsis jejuensis]|uniref:Rid family hydrolase n=1 Tax=Amycolatopsis jejuensis TaxID=330084 RepID=UPI00052740BA|nr:Rid family hydrolase [Amycolatopsis jejuensis]